jgi:hypothetical protein
MVKRQTKDLPMIVIASWWEALGQTDCNITRTLALRKMFCIHDVKKKSGKFKGTID